MFKFGSGCTCQNTSFVSNSSSFASLFTRISRTMALEEKTESKLEQPGASTNSDSDIEFVESGTVNEKSLLRKLDLRLLPAVSILYLLSFLDRSNGA